MLAVLTLVPPPQPRHRCLLCTTSSLGPNPGTRHRKLIFSFALCLGLPCPSLWAERPLPVREPPHPRCWGQVPRVSRNMLTQSQPRGLQGLCAPTSESQARLRLRQAAAISLLSISPGAAVPSGPVPRGPMGTARRWRDPSPAHAPASSHIGKHCNIAKPLVGHGGTGRGRRGTPLFPRRGRRQEEVTKARRGSGFPDQEGEGHSGSAG